MPLRHSRYGRYRFPADVISYAVWLYFRFPLSLRMVAEMLAARGILVSHETVRQRALKFGQGFANQIRLRLPASGNKWHLDEVAMNNHQPTRRRERIMKRFRSAGHAQRFLSVHDQVASLFRRSAKSNASDRRQSRARAFTVWAEVTNIAAGF